MPEITYELRVSAEEQAGPVQMQVISYDSEGENLPGVSVRLEIGGEDASLGSDGLVTRLNLVTNARGKAYFVWTRWPRTQPLREQVSLIKATWQGLDPFVFIERFR